MRYKLKIPYWDNDDTEITGYTELEASEYEAINALRKIPQCIIEGLK